MLLLNNCSSPATSFKASRYLDLEYLRNFLLSPQDRRHPRKQDPESERKKVVFRKIQGEESAARMFSKIGLVDIVKAETEVSTVLLVEVDVKRVVSQGENLA